MVEIASRPAPSLASINPLRAAGVVVASTVGNGLGVTPTVTVVFGVFLAPIAADFHWPRAAVSGAVAVLSVATALASPIAGRMGDAWGARKSVLLGTLLLGLSILALGMAVAQPFLFYLQFALIGAFGALPSSMLYAKILSEWFESRRGLWMGIAGGVGNGLGATLMPLLAGAVLAPFGWRGGFMCIAGVVLLIGLPLQLILIRRSPGGASPLGKVDVDEMTFEGVSAKAALRTTRFWILATSLPIGGGCLTAMFATIVPLVIDRGFSLGVATVVVSVCGLACTAWEPTVGLLLDRTSRPRILAPCYLVAIGGLLLMLTAHGEAMLLLAAVMIAIGLGAEFSALSFLLSRYFGRKALGAVSGVAFAVVLGVGAVSVVLLNTAYDLLGGYGVAVLCLIPLLLWNSAACLILGPYPFTPQSDAAPV